jgi:uncharacterized membrane protein YvbJ
MEVVRPRSATPARRFCPACGATLEGDPRFCSGCGTDLHSLAATTPEPRPEAQKVAPDSFAASPPSPRQAKPWAWIIPLVAAGLAIVLLAGLFASTNGRLTDTRTSLTAAQGRANTLNDKLESSNSQVETLKGEKSSLQTENSSLRSSMVDCKDAASKARAVFAVVASAFRGTASYYDVRTAFKDSNRAWSVCRTEASSNGAI